MKIIKGLSIFLFLAVLLGSCFDEPEYSIIPEIELETVEFVPVGDISDPDSLNLFIKFKDGDGDLGLNNDEIDFPYHDTNFFLEDGNGDTTKIGQQVLYGNLPPFIRLNGATGKLVTKRTRNKSAYSYLPDYYAGSNKCLAYTYDSIYVDEKDKHIFDNTYTIYDTLISSVFPPVYVLLDTFYYEPNPFHYNIEVDFLLQQNGSFEEFDWRALMINGSCGTTFDGRFPVLTDKSRAVEGTILYSMQSSGFLTLFGVKNLKLRIKIRDRALHTSNTLETPAFTLSGIQKGGG